MAPIHRSLSAGAAALAAAVLLVASAPAARAQAPAFCKDLKCPKFSVVKTLKDGIELRKYEPCEEAPAAGGDSGEGEGELGQNPDGRAPPCRPARPRRPPRRAAARRRPAEQASQLMHQTCWSSGALPSSSPRGAAPWQRSPRTP